MPRVPKVIIVSFLKLSLYVTHWQICTKLLKGLGKLPEFQETGRCSKIESRDFVPVKEGKKSEVKIRHWVILLPNALAIFCFLIDSTSDQEIVGTAYEDKIEYEKCYNLIETRIRFST